MSLINLIIYVFPKKKVLSHKIVTVKNVKDCVLLLFFVYVQVIKIVTKFNRHQLYRGVTYSGPTW